MNRRNENDLAAAGMVATFGIAALLLGIVWVFSQTLSLDLNSGGKVLSSLILWGLCVWGLLKLQFFEPADLLPAALAGLWACFWPALSYWSSALFERFHGDPNHVVWWAAWYTKLGVLLGILLVCYGWRWWQEQRW
ncbi:hypothetical protein [Paraburkholderia humisilvae]|uniref:Uncharacterized protein n=1 Tax=Paraburkholderia humisilvae TaxID=627669 RepID=A0A6J5F9J4_9BURK|nr:hypothetical protein [Paraburkholderia humisilvae]CAB3774461.1 hypothetical protein LMG29542_07838 [Paraburkholderia humisilvae]